METSDRDIIVSALLTVATVGQILCSFLFYNRHGNSVWRNAGWIVLCVSAVLLWLPVRAFRARGGVPKGKSYEHTTQLVDSDIYGIVRHPQYLAGILLSAALTMVAQHWVVAALGAVAAVLLYVGAVWEEEDSMGRFGDAYQEYMQRVPRMNLLAGILRRIRRGTA
jgi:protein-S-isoprenylcysteine O-methyltransferase Ste14